MTSINTHRNQLSTLSSYPGVQKGQEHCVPLLGSYTQLSQLWPYKNCCWLSTPFSKEPKTWLPVSFRTPVIFKLQNHCWWNSRALNRTRWRIPANWQILCFASELKGRLGQLVTQSLDSFCELTLSADANVNAKNSVDLQLKFVTFWKT